MFLLILAMIAQGLYAAHHLFHLHFRGDWSYRWSSTSPDGWVWLRKWQAVYRVVYTFYGVLLLESLFGLMLLQYTRISSLNLWLPVILGFIVVLVMLTYYLHRVIHKISDFRQTDLLSFGTVYRLLMHPSPIPPSESRDV